MAAADLVTFLQTQPLQAFWLSILAALAWYTLDEGQIESINFAGRRVAIPGLLVIGAAFNYKLAVGGFQGLTLSVVDGIIALIAITPIIAFVLKRRMN